MSILVKAGTGLAAGIVAGALGLAFFPRVEPTVLKPRNAVEKPQFVAVSPSPTATPANRAPALAVASEPVIEKPAKAADPATDPKPEAKTAEVKPADVKPADPKPADPKPADPKPALTALASLDPPKAPTPAGKALSPLGESRGLSFAPVASAAPAAPAAPLSPPKAALAETRATAAAPATASDASARWSVRGLAALAKGDISTARLYLTRAAEAGDPRAWVALADTYDPAMLTKLGAVIAPGDAQRAKDLLAKAAAAGVVGAKDRMAALEVK